VQGAVAGALDPGAVGEIVSAARPDIVVHADGEASAHDAGGAPAPGGVVAAARAAIECGAATFVRISTTRAADPHRPLGRAARDLEAALLALAAPGGARIACVRVPSLVEDPQGPVARLEAQVAAGGEVTLAHPQATRLLLGAAEAAGLALIAAAETRGGQVFALDAGAPIRLLDVAEALLRRAGRTPGRDAHVGTTGLASDARLDEAAFGPDETAWRTAHPSLLLLGVAHAEAEPSAPSSAPAVPAPPAEIIFAMPTLRAAPEWVGARS
jgi:FlaA1/EpsC-like NDP-sugar epimerase